MCRTSCAGEVMLDLDTRGQEVSEGPPLPWFFRSYFAHLLLQSFSPRPNADVRTIILCQLPVCLRTALWHESMFWHQSKQPFILFVCSHHSLPSLIRPRLTSSTAPDHAVPFHQDVSPQSPAAHFHSHPPQSSQKAPHSPAGNLPSSLLTRQYFPSRSRPCLDH